MTVLSVIAELGASFYMCHSRRSLWRKEIKRKAGPFSTLADLRLKKNQKEVSGMDYMRS